MHTTQRTLTWLLLLILLIPGVALAARQGRLIGKIVDPDGKPIPGVAVTASSKQVPGFRVVKTTDKKGIFILDFEVVEVSYQYKFQAPGFAPLEVNQEWNKIGTEHFEWTMQPAVVTATIGDGAPVSTSETAITAFNTGIAAFKAEDYATAEVKFKEAVAADPNLRVGWAALSSAHLEMGHFKEAAEVAEKAISMGATDEAVLTTRWQAYRNLKDEAKAAEALKELERIGRQTEEAKKIHNEAVALTKTGDNAGAFAKFQEALYVDPNLQASLLGLATAGLKIGKNAEALTAAETILKTEPTNEKAIRIRYNAALALGDKTRLVDALVSIGGIEPAVAKNGLLKLAFEAYDANDLTVAKDRFKKVLLVDPNQPVANNYVGIICVAQGAPEEAKPYLQRFIELAPNDPEAPGAREMLKYLGTKK